MNTHDHSVKKSPDTSTINTTQNERQDDTVSGWESYTMQRAIQQTNTKTLKPSNILQLQRKLGNQKSQQLLGETSGITGNIHKNLSPTFGGLLIQRNITVGGREYTNGGIKQFLQQEHKLDPAGAPFLTEAIWDLSQSQASFTDWQQLITELQSTRKRLSHLQGMINLTGLNMQWGEAAIHPGPNIGAEKAKPFRGWLFNEGPEPTKMNCWESVLFAAYKQNLIDKEYIKRAIKREGGIIALVTAIVKNPSGQARKAEAEFVPQIPVHTIPAGFIILFGEWGEHAAISTGARQPIAARDAKETFGSDTGHGILELDKPTFGVQASTLEDTVMRGGSAYKQVISWGPLPNS